MQTKGFLFDVDGVLYDSMPQHAKACVQAFSEYGLTVPERLIYLYEGMTEGEAIRTIGLDIHAELTEETLNKIVERKRLLFNEDARPPLIRGAKELVEHLQINHFEFCMVTGSYQQKTIAMIQEDFGMEREDIVTGKEITHGKPHPEPFLLGLKKLKLPVSEVIAIENAPLGIESAKSAGLKCVALKTGLLSEAELKKCKADWVFQDCAELLRQLSYLN
ncbi:MAG: HAD family phosphatase [Patescibacteria group bacterium]